ncbi:bacillithiol biosynthesis cysteine-adding enzyme BshC [Bacillus sp. MUM 116]|uniref:bacillithiol biosynthesis cysteine-adding enzyme BshC n=1 Tax=Bacillus sp. MUM 116 TaxID=1678002 RepID=UPI0008F5EA64|nr:bacillithiol biosynthesis cysteine-adding enzyme BshC [Bacillus sp. MUM 116]OIK14043.1 bacillithiol biosynthesis cysteine-adding enzyme BshC [Bacillus sp. MUM 116]
MEILNLSLPAVNRFASNYLEQAADIQTFFHYRYNQISDDQDRLTELKNRRFPREKLTEHIRGFMKGYPSSKAVEKSFEKLLNPESVVVIGGQQAGILTGPLYSIHKVISIIKLAEQKERQLGVPVIPVFWIAGEDHDFQEVNHVFVPVDKRVDKWIYPEKVFQKKMVSDIHLDKDICLAWVQNVIENFGETNHTNKLIAFAEEQISKSVTFVDFFANIVMEMFKDYGLLIIDSGDRLFRQIQKEFLTEQIIHHNSITYSLLKQQNEISQKGYPITIEANERAANLFYYDERLNERILLEYNLETDRFVGKSGSISLTKDELMEIAGTEPEKLSNNVVTRPLMQELLFPTIAFIAGPGEISYWAELKLVFELFNMKMPPIVPRLNITFLDRSIETDLDELNLSLSTVLTKGSSKEKEQFLDSVKDKEAEDLFLAAKEQLTSQYRLIEAKTVKLDKGLLPLLKKNEIKLIKELEFMQKKLEDSVKLKYDVILNKFNRVDLSLRPDGFPQERTWNIFYYLNQYGLDLIRNIMELSFEFDGRHKIIKM